MNSQDDNLVWISKGRRVSITTHIGKRRGFSQSYTLAEAKAIFEQLEAAIERLDDERE